MEYIFFEETWDSASFSYQNWTREYDYWQIDTLAGNPSPCAKFTSDSVLNDYECTLLSKDYYGWGIGGIRYASKSHIDIKLEGSNNSSTEKLIINLYDKELGILYSSDTIINNIGSDWFTLEYYYSDCVYIGQIEIIATGESTENIGAWYIDNVKDQVCGPVPVYLIKDVHDTNGLKIIHLDWVINESPGWGYWVKYNDWDINNALASPDGGYGSAQLFDIENDFSGMGYPFTVYQIGYYNDGYGNSSQQEELMLLNGEGSEIISGPYYIHNAQPDEYLLRPIDPIVFDSGNFMVATINTYAGGPYVGVDDSFYNETLFWGSVGDWTELGEMGYQYVGSHRAFCAPGSWYTSPVKYNVYRKILSGEFEKLNDTLIGETEYRDTIPNNEIYWYYVTGVYEECESDSSRNILIDPFVNEELNNIENAIQLFPNPATDQIKITLPENLHDIIILKIFSITGRLILSNSFYPHSSQKVVDISKLHSGFYFVNISIGNRGYAQKLIIQ
ncbi:MAG: T9SS type A sorting domain-containing protein [Bacteroidota bacterium]|nr:T9SS type A sorting domain-containing protein [Bacteroidota bacterium]